jgi:hypothetical protein
MAGQQEDGKKVEQWRDARVGWDDVKRGPNPGLLEGNRGDPQQEITSLPQEVLATVSMGINERRINGAILDAQASPHLNSGKLAGGGVRPQCKQNR